MIIMLTLIKLTLVWHFGCARDFPTQYLYSQELASRCSNPPIWTTDEETDLYRLTGLFKDTQLVGARTRVEAQVYLASQSVP